MYKLVHALAQRFSLRFDAVLLTVATSSFHHRLPEASVPPSISLAHYVQASLVISLPRVDTSE